MYVILVKVPDTKDQWMMRKFDKSVPAERMWYQLTLFPTETTLVFLEETRREEPKD
jgi:hypothetical protein